ncbi:hypothetical protein L1887_57251 [Cichorium endivia]|nr:hypothetical protein L1887_57251 [Cichorium endivia]
MAPRTRRAEDVARSASSASLKSRPRTPRPSTTNTADTGASSDRIRLLEAQMSGMQSMISELVASIKANTNAIAAPPQPPQQPQQQQQAATTPPLSSCFVRFRSLATLLPSFQHFESRRHRGPSTPRPIHAAPGYPLQQPPNFQTAYGHPPSKKRRPSAATPLGISTPFSAGAGPDPATIPTSAINPQSMATSSSRRLRPSLGAFPWREVRRRFLLSQRSFGCSSSSHLFGVGHPLQQCQQLDALRWAWRGRRWRSIARPTSATTQLSAPIEALRGLADAAAAAAAEESEGHTSNDSSDERTTALTTIPRGPGRGAGECGRSVVLQQGDEPAERNAARHEDKSGEGGGQSPRKKRRRDTNGASPNAAGGASARFRYAGGSVWRHRDNSESVRQHGQTHVGASRGRDTSSIRSRLRRPSISPFYHNSPQSSHYTGSPTDVNSVGGESMDGKTGANVAGANAVAAVAAANGNADAAAKRELDELKDLARGARLWFFPVLFDHQGVVRCGQAAMLSKHYVPQLPRVPQPRLSAHRQDGRALHQHARAAHHPRDALRLPWRRTTSRWTRACSPRCARILLAQAWKKIADLSPAIGLYAALVRRSDEARRHYARRDQERWPSDSGISLLYKLLQEYQNGQLEGDEDAARGEGGAQSVHADGAGAGGEGASGARTPGFGDLANSSKWLMTGISSPSVGGAALGAAGSGAMSPNKAATAGLFSHRGSISGFDQHVGGSTGNAGNDGLAWSSFDRCGHAVCIARWRSIHKRWVVDQCYHAPADPAAAVDAGSTGGAGDLGAFDTPAGGAPEASEVKPTAAARSWGHQDHYQSPVPHASQYTSPVYQTPQTALHPNARQDAQPMGMQAHHPRPHMVPASPAPQLQQGLQPSNSTNFDTVLSDLGLPLDGLDGLFGDLPINAPTAQSNYSV